MTTFRLTNPVPSVNSPRDELDRFYTPAPLAEVLVAQLPIDRQSKVLEPHAGLGAFARAARRVGAIVTANDIDPGAPGLEYGQRSRCGDFLTMPDERFDWIIGNPPYSAAEQHVVRSLTMADDVAFLLRLAYLESAERIPFWSGFPAYHVFVLAQRPSFTGQGTDSCAYGWFWWKTKYKGATTLSVLDWQSGDQLDLLP